MSALQNSVQTETSVQDSDREILRRLGEEIATIGNLPVQSL